MALPLDFALEGFRILRARPKLIAFWGAVSLFGYGVCVLIAVAIIGPSQPAFIAFSHAPTDTVQAGFLTQKIMTALIACAPVYVITSAVLNCAVCRAVLDSGSDRLGYLRFGLREIQVGVVLGVTIALQMAAFILVAGLWVSIRLGDNFNVLGMFIAAGASLWLRVKLSLNTVQSFATRRMDIFSSFALTRDQFASLLAGYIVAFGLAMTVTYLSEEVVNGVLAAVFSIKQGGLTLDVSSLSAFLTAPRVTALVLILAGVWPQTIAILFGAPAAAYTILNGSAKTAPVQSLL